MKSTKRSKRTNTNTSPQSVGSSRRAFLRGSSAVIALPLMESFGWQRFAAAEPVAAPPKRMVFLGIGWGVTKETWFPNRKQSGADYELPAGLAPLAKHKNDFTIIQNLTNQYNNEAHWGSTFYLTGANRYAIPGQSFHNSISADQVAAEVLGRQTRFTSLQFDSKDAKNSGHGPGLSLAWNRQGKPLAGLNTPVAAFHRLFSDEDMPLEQRQDLLNQQRSVLDVVLEDAKSVGRGLNTSDKNKLNEYLDSIRDIENRISKEEQWLNVPKKKPGREIQEPGDVVGVEEVKLMHELMLAAMQVDATRVLTYRQPVQTFIKSQGATISAHNMSHYTSGERRSVSENRDLKLSELLASFLTRLKQTKEVDGSSLFDHVSLSYGTNINSIHYLDNCPTIVAGNGAGVKLGQHVVAQKNTPLCNLWLTLLRGSGVSVNSHGDSTGVVNELIA